MIFISEVLKEKQLINIKKCSSTSEFFRTVFYIYIQNNVPRRLYFCKFPMISKTTKRIFMPFSPIDRAIREEGLGV